MIQSQNPLLGNAIQTIWLLEYHGILYSLFWINNIFHINVLWKQHVDKLWPKFIRSYILFHLCVPYLVVIIATQRLNQKVSELSLPILYIYSTTFYILLLQLSKCLLASSVTILTLIFVPSLLASIGLWTPKRKILNFSLNQFRRAGFSMHLLQPLEIVTKASDPHENFNQFAVIMFSSFTSLACLNMLCFQHEYVVSSQKPVCSWN